MSEPLGAVIVGTGSALPERVLTNHDLEAMVDTSDEWIFTRTGIRQRHIADDDIACSDLATEAGRKALDMAGVDPKDVNLIITATLSPDQPFPATSCLVQHNLGCSNAGGFDLEAACSGFVYAQAMADGYLRANPTHTALIIGSEILSRVTNWEDRTSCILFGDGAGAAVLQTGPADRGVMSTELGVDGSGADLMYLAAGGSRRPASAETLAGDEHKMVIKGREVFKFAVNKMGELVHNAIERHGLKPNDVALIVPHQVNTRILSACAERNGLSMDKVYVNIDRIGNTSAASVPIALDEANRKGLIKEGDVVIMVGFGGGLTWACSITRW